MSEPAFKSGYDQVTIGVISAVVSSTESEEATFSFLLISSTTASLSFGVGGRSGRTNQSQGPAGEHCDWFILPILLPTTTM